MAIVWIAGIKPNTPKVYEAITAHYLQHGLFPSIDDICLATGFQKSTVHKHLQMLLAVGRIEQPRKGYAYKLPDAIMVQLLKERIANQKGKK